MHHVLLVFLGVLLSPLARVRSSVAWSIALLLAIYAALYADASWDYAGYLEYFDCIRGRSCAEDVSERVELTFLATASFLGLLLGSAGGPFLVAIYSSTAVMLKLHLLSRECKSFGVALLGYLCIGWFLHEMTQIRVGLAVAFLWLAVHALSAQLRVRAVAYFGMAVLVHYSAALGLIYFVFRRPIISPKIWIACLSATALLGIALST